jgi:hypothetical protein
VANIATNQLVGGLAYSDLFQAPTSVYPSNVVMGITLYGSPNLPMGSLANAATKLNLMTWFTNCSKLQTYDYALLFTDYSQLDPRLPVPMVSGIVDHGKFLSGIGALSGECQATDASIQYNPWDFYAYPRIRWNTNYTSSQLLSEFFNGYYKEAAGPMLAYYQAMENYQYSNNADLHYQGYCYWANPGTFPRFVLYQMQTNLQAARSLATNWYVINRVNDITNSFNWLLQSALGITNLNTLTDFSSFATVPANGTFTVPITGFANRPHAAHGFYNAAFNEGGNGGWNFDGTSIIQQTLNFTKSGNYRVDVIGGCKFDNGGNSDLKVYLGASFGIINISSVAYLTNSFVLNVPIPTAFDLALEDDNFGKYFLVSQVQITAQ